MSTPTTTYQVHIITCPRFTSLPPQSDPSRTEVPQTLAWDFRTRGHEIHPFTAGTGSNYYFYFIFRFFANHTQLSSQLSSAQLSSAVRCRTVRCAALRCAALRCGAVPCRAVPCRAVPCRAVPCRAALCCAVLCCPVLCCGMCCAVLCSVVF